jgi:aspartate kinase
VFERHRTAVDVVTTSEVSVSVTIDDVRRLDAIVQDLSTFADVTIAGEMALVCAVGERLRTDPSLSARVVGALDGFALRMVSQAGSRRNITFVLPQADLVDAMQRLHERFCLANLPGTDTGTDTATTPTTRTTPTASMTTPETPTPALAHTDRI